MIIRLILVSTLSVLIASPAFAQVCQGPCGSLGTSSPAAPATGRLEWKQCRPGEPPSSCGIAGGDAPAPWDAHVCTTATLNLPENEERVYWVKGADSNHFDSSWHLAGTCTGLPSGCPSCGGGFALVIHAIRGNFSGSVQWLPDGQPVTGGEIAARRRGACGDPGQSTQITASGHYDFAAAQPPPAPANNWGVNIGCYQPFADGPVTQAFDLACFSLNQPNLTVASTSSSQTAMVDMSCLRPGQEPPIGPPTPPSPAPTTPCSAPGQPIEVTNGNVHFEQTDAVPGVAAGGLSFVRRYNSINAADPARYGVFGPGWYHNYEKRIASYDATHDVVKLREADGGPRYFKFDRVDVNDRIYVASVPFTSESLIRKRQDGTFVREFRRGGSEQYAALPSGRLTAIVDPCCARQLMPV